jgi:hypothetical protein
MHNMFDSCIFGGIYDGFALGQHRYRDKTMLWSLRRITAIDDEFGARHEGRFV